MELFLSQLGNMNALRMVATQYDGRLSHSDLTVQIGNFVVTEDSPENTKMPAQDFNGVISVSINMEPATYYSFGLFEVPEGMDFVPSLDKVRYLVVNAALENGPTTQKATIIPHQGLRPRHRYFLILARQSHPIYFNLPHLQGRAITVDDITNLIQSRSFLIPVASVKFSA